MLSSTSSLGSSSSIVVDYDSHIQEQRWKQWQTANNLRKPQQQVLQLLEARQLHGCVVPARPNRAGYPRRLLQQQRRGRVHLQSSSAYLSSRIAWNKNRMQNMILAVGPTTPASQYWRRLNGLGSETDPQQPSGSSSVADDNDDDDDDEEDSQNEDDSSHEEEDADEEALFDVMDTGAGENDDNNDDDDDEEEENDSQSQRMRDEEDGNEEGAEDVTMQEAGEQRQQREGAGGQGQEQQQQSSRRRQTERAAENDSDNDDDEEERGSGHVAAMALAGYTQVTLETTVSRLGGQTNRRITVRSSTGPGGGNDERVYTRREFLRILGRQHRRQQQQLRLLAEQQQQHQRNGNTTNRQRPVWMPSLRHGGCINTATWLDCPWRLSLGPAAASCNANSNSNGSNVVRTMCINSEEVPTQLATSGDDRLVKFWDVSHAMGMANPWPGGWDTFCPYAYSSRKYGSGADSDEDDDDDDNKSNSSETSENNNNSGGDNENRTDEDGQQRNKRARLSKEVQKRRLAIAPPRGGNDADCMRYYSAANNNRMAGCVLPLATLATGHRGNVFHATPVHGLPGKILTSGADGYLRLSDLESPDRGSIVVHPYVEENSDDMENTLASFVFHSGMAYSHHMTSVNTGLLCSERGLHRFDLRLSPREQHRRSLIVGGFRPPSSQPSRRSSAGGRRRSSSGNDEDLVAAADDDDPEDDDDDEMEQFSLASSRARSCKACAIWSPTGNHKSVDMATMEANYVFAGGASEYVGLYDLRMDASSTASLASSAGTSRGTVDATCSRIIQLYKPNCLDVRGSVSVSGLDVSKDGKELLVSFESDQIYSFPIMHQAASAAGPTLEELEASSKQAMSKDDPNVITQLASYGGHLNRFTFLKNARYAGPMDDYICTGSDSGHAWIYERATGTVVSFMSADRSTCNGVIPHPILPFFITYGIDSTAKLWRATTPVDRKADDSQHGRIKASLLSQPYEMSPVTRAWNGVQALVRHFKDEPAIMPDYVASGEEIAASGRFSSPCRRGIVDSESPRIGNALRTLPMLVRQNRYECYRVLHDGTEAPVDHPLIEMTHRVSLIRLRQQADRLGIPWNPNLPWSFQPRKLAKSSGATDGDGAKDFDSICAGFHPADLVPDNPSDWIHFDGKMQPIPLHPRKNFNLDDYENLLHERFDTLFGDKPDDSDIDVPWLDHDRQTVDRKSDLSTFWSTRDEDSAKSVPTVTRARKLLYETALLLKEGGNVAMRAGLLQVAARRYDKTIQYCAVAFMRYLEGEKNLSHLTAGHTIELPAGLCDRNDDEPVIGGGGGGNRSNKKRPGKIIIIVWSPLLRVLITARLNMALLFSKPEFGKDSARAADQAKIALRLLEPFTVKEGKIIIQTINNCGKDIIVKDNEPKETYRDAKALEAKAYFRLGSAELDSGEYSMAIESFQQSMKCSTASSSSCGGNGSGDGNCKPDALVVRRLQEAKRKHKSKNKRDRKRYERMFNNNNNNTASNNSNNNNKAADAASAAAAASSD